MKDSHPQARLPAPLQARQPSALLRYTFALVSVGVSALVRFRLHHVLGTELPGNLFVPAIVLSGWFGGWGPGLLATALSVATATYFFMEPLHSWRVEHVFDFLRLLSLTALGVAVCFFRERLGAATLLAEEGQRIAREEQAARAASDAQYRRMVETANEGVWSIDAQGRTTYLNRRMAEMLGYAPEEVMGRNAFEFVHEAHLPQVVSDWERRRTGESSQQEFRLRRKDGSDLWVISMATPILNAEGRFDGAFSMFTDITRRVKVEEAQRTSEDLLQAVVDGTNDLIYVKDAHGKYLMLNEATLRALGKTMAEAIGKDDADLFPAESAAELMAGDRRVMREGRVQSFEERVTNGGLTRTYLSTKAPYRGASGNIIGVVGISRDITDRKESERERLRLLEREQAARQEAEEANRLKDDFLATLSHELRTPLNAIVGWTHLLRGGQLDPETTTRAIEVIDRNAKSQAQLVADVLDVSRMVSGKLRLDVARVDLVAVIEAALESAVPAATAKEISVTPVLDPNAGSVSGDRDRLQQVVWNLLTNAIKFTPRKGHVHVRLARADSHVEICVEDTGPGIAPEVLPHVFERFRQGDSSSTRAHGGLGLGLAIVRHLVEMHGGTVRAESAGLGHGASFTVRLPMMAVDPGSIGA